MGVVVQQGKEEQHPSSGLCASVPENENASKAGCLASSAILGCLCFVQLPWLGAARASSLRCMCNEAGDAWACISAGSSLLVATAALFSLASLPMIRQQS